MYRLTRKVKELTKALETLKSKHQSKGVGNRVSQERLLRVILTAPNVSSRALAEAFRLALKN